MNEVTQCAGPVSTNAGLISCAGVTGSGCITYYMYTTPSAVCLCDNIGLVSLILLGLELHVSYLYHRTMCTRHPNLVSLCHLVKQSTVINKLSLRLCEGGSSVNIIMTLSVTLTSF